MTVFPATLLSPQQVERVHEASLEVLRDVGVDVNNRRAGQIFSGHGCHVQDDGPRITFPVKVVEQFRAAMPECFTFHGRDPRYDRTIPADRPLVLTASSAPNVIDPATGNQRPATSDDLARWPKATRSSWSSRS